MIQAVELIDFQKHERKRIDFDPRVTTLVGPNGSGKSTVIRAIRWAAFNRPAGTRVIRHDSDRATVKLWIGDVRIFRSRGQAINVYRLTTDGRTKEFKAFGMGVPDEVTAACELDEINFQLQSDPPLWLKLPPPEAAREMNRVVDLDIIDHAMQKAKTLSEAAQAKAEAGRKAREEYEGTIKALSWVPGADQVLTRLKASEIELTRGEQRVAVLENLTEQAITTANRFEEATKALAALGRLRAYLDARKAVATLETLLARRKEELKVVVPDLDAIESRFYDLYALGHRIKRLESLLQRRDLSEEQRCRKLKECTTKEAELERKVGRKCPVCGQPKRKTK